MVPSSGCIFLDKNKNEILNKRVFDKLRHKCHNAFRKIYDANCVQVTYFCQLRIGVNFFGSVRRSFGTDLGSNERRKKLATRN